MKNLFLFLLFLGLKQAGAQLCFKPVTKFVTGNIPRSVVSADFNGDSIPDLAVANQNSNFLSVLWGNGLGGG